MLLTLLLTFSATSFIAIATNDEVVDGTPVGITPVKPNLCDNDKQCPFTNEEYTDCKKECPSDTCSSVVSRCIPSDTCSPGCVCSPGYLRKAEGEPCVPECQCPELKNTLECQKSYNCTGPNEVYASDGACDTECKNLNEESSVLRLGCVQNKCTCIKGHARDNNNICIPISECPIIKDDRCPGDNEHYACVQSCPPEKSCRNKDTNISCLAWIQPCQYRCVCNKKYLRNSKGQCVLLEDCDE